MVRSRRHSFDRCALGALLVAGFACAAVASAQNAGGPRPDRGIDFDDLMVRVAQRAPAFGGLFVDEATNTLRVHSWNRTLAGAAEVETALRGVLGAALPAGRLEIVPGVYGFAELKGWHDRLLEVMALPGVVSTDIDDRVNRLEVGVERAEVGWRVRDRLGRLGIPGEAVEIVERAPVRLETGLRSQHRPLVGGLQISFLSGASAFLCTEGFHAVRGKVSGFVTNSHCTATQGGVQSTVIYQPSTVFSANRVGVEAVDPGYFSGAPCPPGRRCRRSDSAFVRRDGSVTSSPGRIARTATDSLLWNGTDTFRIVREAEPVVGQTLTKVGRTTGRTQGVVTNVCITLNVSGSTITQLCQSIAGYSSAGGDSGSPVFRVVNKPSANDVWLAGIHWGSGGAFSTIGQIQRAVAPAELGSLRTCAAGFTC